MQAPQPHDSHNDLKKKLEEQAEIIRKQKVEIEKLRAGCVDSREAGTAAPTTSSLQQPPATPEAGTGVTPKGISSVRPECSPKQSEFDQLGGRSDDITPNDSVEDPKSSDQARSTRKRKFDELDNIGDDSSADDESADEDAISESKGVLRKRKFGQLKEGGDGIEDSTALHLHTKRKLNQSELPDEE
jgi:hypothetical protein